MMLSVTHRMGASPTSPSSRFQLEGPGLTFWMTAFLALELGVAHATG